MMLTVQDLLGPLKAIGPPPIGNPAEARAYAQQLRAAADDLRQQADGVRRAGEIGGFEGPAAQRHRDAASDLATALANRAGSVDSIADQVLYEAGNLERLQHQWRSRARAISGGVEQVLRQALAYLGWRMP